MNKFPPTAVRERLAREVGGTMRQIQVWFQNRRQRDQSHHPANHGPLVIPFVPAVPGFYPPQQGPLSPYGAQGLPQPIMYAQPPMVPIHGALQNGFPPGPPQMPLPGAPGAVSMPMAPMPMPIQPGNAAGQPPPPPHSRARLSTLFAHGRARARHCRSRTRPEPRTRARSAQRALIPRTRTHARSPVLAICFVPASLRTRRLVSSPHANGATTTAASAEHAAGRATTAAIRCGRSAARRQPAGAATELANLITAPAARESAPASAGSAYLGGTAAAPAGYSPSAKAQQPVCLSAGRVRGRAALL